MYNNSQDNHLIMYSWRPESALQSKSDTTMSAFSSVEQRAFKAATTQQPASQAQRQNKQHQHYSAVFSSSSSSLELVSSVVYEMVSLFSAVHSKVRKSWESLDSTLNRECLCCVNFSLNPNWHPFCAIPQWQWWLSCSRIDLFIQVKDYNSHGFPHLCHTTLSASHSPCAWPVCLSNSSTYPNHPWQQQKHRVFYSPLSLRFLPSDKMQEYKKTAAGVLHTKTRASVTKTTASLPSSAERAWNGWIVLWLAYDHCTSIDCTNTHSKRFHSTQISIAARKKWSQE